VKDVQVHANRTEEAARNAAKQYDLNPDQFVAFMNTRFGHYSPCYAYEWAERIAAGRAYRCADEKTRDALRDAGYRNR
jgi:hypothetical protein